MRGRLIADDELIEAIASVKHTACRWEHQPYYNEPGEAELIDEWESGGAGHPPLDHPWVTMLASFRETGRRLVRVRVQENPTNRYQQWLAHMAANFNIPAGEEIRVMPRSKARLISPLLSRRRQDWWLLDERRIVLMTVDPDGHRVATELRDGGLAVARACAWWGLAVHLSTPAPNQGVLTTT